MANIYNHYPCFDNTPKPPKVAYLCDRLACPDCSYPTCKHTLDISHAVNFESFQQDGEKTYRYIEKEHAGDFDFEGRIAELEDRLAASIETTAAKYAEKAEVIDLEDRVGILEAQVRKFEEAPKPVKYPVYDYDDRTTSGLIEEY
jgi:hypothetical protein